MARSSYFPPSMDSMISQLRVWPIWKELKHFAVSAACEDSSTSTRADEFCRSLSRDLAPSCTIAKELWLFNQLCVPGLRAIAAGEAALAQLIIISVHHAESLPEAVKRWIDLWLGQRNGHNNVLLALFDPVYQGVSNSMRGYLQEVAKRGNMELLVKSEDASDYRRHQGRLLSSMLRCRSDQNQPSNCLIELEMKKSEKPLPPLEKGQLWKTDNGYIQIWHIGKRLVDYKMMKQPGRKAVRTQATTIETLNEYLKNQKAVLTVASRA